MLAGTKKQTLIPIYSTILTRAYEQIYFYFSLHQTKFPILESSLNSWVSWYNTFFLFDLAVYILRWKLDANWVRGRDVMPNHVSGGTWSPKDAARVQSCPSCPLQRNFCVVLHLTLELYVLHTRQDVVTWFIYFFLQFSRKVSWSRVFEKCGNQRAILCLQHY